MSFVYIPPAVANEFSAVAAANIINGAPIVINSNGTVSPVGLSISPTPSLGTAANLASATNIDLAIDYSINQNVFVIVYIGLSNFVYAVAATVSGGTTTYGTPVVIDSTTTLEISECVCDPLAGQFVIATETASQGRSFVNQLSGTTITAGANVLFLASRPTSPSLFYLNNGKLAVVYKDPSNNITVTAGTLNAGFMTWSSSLVLETVNGDNIGGAWVNSSAQLLVAYRRSSSSVGINPVTINTTTLVITAGTFTYVNGSNYGKFSGIYDSTASLAILVSLNFTAGTGQALVVSISGAVATVAGITNFGGGSTISPKITLDTTTNQIIIAPYGDSNIYFASVNPSSITINNTLPYPGSNIAPAIIYSLFQDKSEIVYYTGTNIVSQVVFSQTSVTNLTSENFIGFADNNYLLNQIATIQTIGFVDDAQTGLTPGQTYYVQTNGTLALTPDPSVSVVAGTAVATNKIIVKG